MSTSLFSSCIKTLCSIVLHELIKEWVNNNGLICRGLVWFKEDYTFHLNLCRLDPFYKKISVMLNDGFFRSCDLSCPYFCCPF